VKSGMGALVKRTVMPMTMADTGSLTVTQSPAPGAKVNHRMNRPNQLKGALPGNKDHPNRVVAVRWVPAAGGTGVEGAEDAYHLATVGCRLETVAATGTEIVRRLIALLAEAANRRNRVGTSAKSSGIPIYRRNNGH
jgi:hypothetical protein